MTMWYEEVRVRGDYRTFLQHEERAKRYESKYSGDSYDNWVWNLEQGYLVELIDRHLGDRPGRYLDFACGTGRVISFLEPRVHTSTGVDVSASMLELAAPKLAGSTLICGDPTANPTLIPGPYDLITAFRFFLNAQDDLREAALRVLHGALADEGLLVFNIHGNRWSLRLPGVLVRRYLLRQTNPNRLNSLSYPKMRRLLARHGLRVVEVRGCSFLPRQLRRLLGVRLARKLEALGTRSPTRYLAVNLLVACRKA